MNWREYEIYITRHFRKIFPDATITRDVRREGVLSKTRRQIDILIEQRLAGFELSIVVDCKYFNKKVGIKEVESFLSFMADVQCSKGVMITNVGYTAPAYKRATYDSRDIDLRIINFQDLERFQGFIAIPYSGNHGAVISAPNGWVVDSSPQGPYLCSLYPAGMSQAEAFRAEGFIYVVFSQKDDKWPDLGHLLRKQEADLRRRYRSPRIDYVNTIEREDCIVALRVVEAEEFKGTLDYTLLMDYPGVIIFMTLLSPTSKVDTYVKKLEWIAEKLIKLAIIHDTDGKPM